MSTLQTGTLHDLCYIRQPSGHIYGSEAPVTTGIWNVTDYRGGTRRAKGVEMKSTGAAGKLRVHLVDSSTIEGSANGISSNALKWFDIELWPNAAGISPKGYIFDMIDWTNSTAVYGDVVIFF